MASDQEFLPTNPDAQSHADKRIYGVGIDAGSTNTRCVVISAEGNTLQFVGAGQAKSAGWVKGVPADDHEVAHGIGLAVSRAIAEKPIQVDSATFGVGGRSVHGENKSVTRTFFFGHKIERKDLELMFAKLKESIGVDYRLIDYMWTSFSIDGRRCARPLGEKCRRLTLNAGVMVAPSSELLQLQSAFRRSYIKVESLVFEPVAASYAMFDPKEDKRTTLVIDVGSSSSGIAIWQRGILAGVLGEPIGGGHFTRDLAFVMDIDFEGAERFKVDHGYVFPPQRDYDRMSQSNPHGVPITPHQLTLLTQVLDSRANEFFERIVERIGHFSPFGAVYFVGGASLLGGLRNLGERLMDCSITEGVQTVVASCPPELSNPAWTTAVGLAVKSARERLTRAKALHEPIKLSWSIQD